MSDKLRVAVAGLGFGAEFVPIYLHHPQVESLTICDSNPAIVDAVTASAVAVCLRRTKSLTIAAHKSKVTATMVTRMETRR